MQIKLRLSCMLMYLGLLPFVISTGIAVHDDTFLILGVGIVEIISSYSLLIGSFMAGIYWGQHLNQSPLQPKFLALFSNGITLSFWFGYLFLSFSGFTLLSIILFALLLCLDIHMARQEKLQPIYAQNRVIVTLIVIGCLTASNLLLYFPEWKNTLCSESV